MEEKQQKSDHNFHLALISIVAIVGIVALVGMFKGNAVSKGSHLVVTKLTEEQLREEQAKNLAGRGDAFNWWDTMDWNTATGIRIHNDNGLGFPECIIYYDGLGNYHNGCEDS